MLYSKHVYLFFETDTERAVGLLRRYQANLTSPEEQTLKNSVGKVSAVLGSQLFQALLGEKKKYFTILPYSLNYLKVFKGWIQFFLFTHYSY